MSDAQKLKDCIAEFHKAKEAIDNKLKRANEERQQSRQADADKQRQPG